jgi:Ca-activated chloride channel family protein
MKLAWASALAAAAAVVSLAAGVQDRAVRITYPPADSIVSGQTRIEATITPPDLVPQVASVVFYANGRLLCTAQRQPFACPWDPGDAVRGNHLRVVATLSDGTQLKDNIRTKDLGYAEQVRTEAILVPVIVTDHGRFVGGLRQQDFEIFEDEQPQRVATITSEDSPLDLIVAIDISGSMEDALEDVKAAVKQLLSKLRPGDAVTLLGFNDTTFVVAEREKNRQVRESAVDLLSAWGGTALYDATVRALELVTRQTGRKGVVIFSDGDDRNSLTTRDTAMSRVQSSDAMLYTIGFGAGATVARLRTSLESYARATGGRPFFPRQAKALDGVFDEIVADLAHQYVLSYAPSNVKRDGSWRKISVRVRNGRYDVRARRGYRADKSEQQVGS